MWVGWSPRLCGFPTKIKTDMLMSLFLLVRKFTCFVHGDFFVVFFLKPKKPDVLRMKLL